MLSSRYESQILGAGNDNAGVARVYGDGRFNLLTVGGASPTIPTLDPVDNSGRIVVFGVELVSATLGRAELDIAAGPVARNRPTMIKATTIIIGLLDKNDRRKIVSNLV